MFLEILLTPGATLIMGEASWASLFLLSLPLFLSFLIKLLPLLPTHANFLP